MIDARLNNIIRPYFRYLAKIFVKFKVNPNSVTFVGFFFGLLCFYYVINLNFFSALIFLLLNRFCDGLDGAIARLVGETDIGAFYDIILDFIFYSLFPISFIFVDIQNVYAICFLLLSFVATQTTFLATAWIVEKNKISVSDKKMKSFFYTGGLTEGFETIVCFLLMLILNDHIQLISYVFGSLCWITFLTRVIYIRNLLIS